MLGGEAFARFRRARCRTMCSPGSVSDVFMDPAAVGPDKTDGVTFIVRASSGANQVSRQFTRRRTAAVD